MVHPSSTAAARLGIVPDAAHPSHQRVREAAARRGVTIEVMIFEKSTHTAQEAADAIGAELGQIVKSLVFMLPADPVVADSEMEPLIALVCGTDRVDVAKLSLVTGRPRVRRASAKEASDATGFSIGGIPPFGHTQRISVVMDTGLDGYEVVWAAAGSANAVFPIAPATLRMLSDALVAPCTEDPRPEGARS